MLPQEKIPDDVADAQLQNGTINEVHTFALLAGVLFTNQSFLAGDSRRCRRCPTAKRHRKRGNLFCCLASPLLITPRKRLSKILLSIQNVLGPEHAPRRLGTPMIFSQISRTTPSIFRDDYWDVLGVTGMLLLPSISATSRSSRKRKSSPPRLRRSSGTIQRTTGTRRTQTACTGSPT